MSCGTFDMWGTPEEMLEEDPNVFCGKDVTSEGISKSPRRPMVKENKSPHRNYPPRKYTFRQCAHCYPANTSYSPGYPITQDPTAIGCGAWDMYEPKKIY